MGLGVSVAIFMEHYLRHRIAHGPPGVCLYSPNIIINGTLFSTLKYVPVGVLSCVPVLVKGDLPESIEVA